MPINRQHSHGFRLAIFATCLAMIVIVLGSFTRLVDAGLGCPDWPGCYGHLLWPNAADEIHSANQRYSDALPVDVSKTWPEMVHRYFAGMLGIVIFVLMSMAFKYRHKPNYPWRLPIILSLLVVWQAVFGMWTVTLKLLPQIVSIHLLGGFATFSLLALLSLRLSKWRWQVNRTITRAMLSYNKWILGGLVLIIVQIFLGGWLAANYAALVCPGFPDCLAGEFFPSADYMKGFDLTQQIVVGSGYQTYQGGILPFEARLAIHIVHRVGAVVLAAYWALLLYRLFKIKFDGLRQWLKLIGVLLVTQIALGIGNIVFGLPLAIAMAHNFVGALLLAAVVLLIGNLYLSKNSGITDV